MSSERRLEDGASAVEYGLLVAAIAAVVAALAFVLGGMVHSSFGGTCGELKSELSASGSC